MASSKYFMSKRALGLSESASDHEMATAIQKLKTPQPDPVPIAKPKKKAGAR